MLNEGVFVPLKFKNIFCIIALFLVGVSACSAQEKLSPAEQERNYNKAHGSIFYNMNPIPDEEAFSLLLKAAESGHAPSQWYLGEIYEQGKAGLPIDNLKSMDWMLKSVDQGYLNAELKMAEAYMFSEGVERDFNKAFNYLTSASEKDHPKAYFILSTFHYV